ncbi:MAG: T9SS type A sorting domain-containing protein [Paludibacteraceae bacterium]
MNKSHRVAITNDAAQKAPAQKTVTTNEGDTIYADDFEGATTDWTVDSLAMKEISQLGLANDVKGCSGSGCFEAFSGSQFLISGYSSASDVKTYIKSPKIVVPAGTYWVSAYFMTGGSNYPCTGKFLYGTSADPASQTEIISFDENSVSQEWTLLKYQIKVDAESALYFTLVSEMDKMTETAGGWFVAMEDFRITKSEVFPPSPQVNDVVLNIYAAEGVYSALSDSIYLASDSSNFVIYGDYNYADTAYFRNVTTDIVFNGKSDVIVGAVNTEKNPLALSYEFYVENTQGKDSASYSYALFHNYSGDHRDLVTNLRSDLSENFYFDLLGDVYFLPEYQTTPFTGYGERFCVTALGDENPHYAQLNGVGLVLYNYWIKEDHQIADSITISVYAENYDEETEEVSIGDCIGKVRMSFADAFGVDQYIVTTPTPYWITLPESINVYGTFYVFVEADAFELADAEACHFMFYEVAGGFGSEPNLLYYPDNTSYIIYKGEKRTYNGAVGGVYEEITGKSYYWSATSMFMADVTFQGAEPEAVGIKRVVADSKLAIYPNPAKDMLYISNLASDASAVVTDLTGKQLMSLSHVQNSVSVAGLAQGVYFISIKDAEGVHTAKFVKE